MGCTCGNQSTKEVERIHGAVSYSLSLSLYQCLSLQRPQDPNLDQDVVFLMTEQDVA